MYKSIRAFSSLLCPCFFAVFLLVGCTPQDEIKTSAVSRTSPPRPPVDLETEKNRLDHILVAIVPQEKKAWFFKLSGKALAVERQRPAFHEFLATVKLANSSDDTPSWQLPEGWKEETSKSRLRLLTLVVPDEAGPMEVSVSSLNLPGEWDDFLVININRWLRQLQRLPLPDEKVLRLAKKTPTQGGQATVLELSGVLKEMRQSNPHAGLGIPAPSSPAPTSPTPSSSTSAQPPKGPLSYDTPEGWQPGKLNSMRKAAFLLPDGISSDEVVVTSFPAGNTQMADVTLNVRRWAGQVGLSSISDDEIDELAEPITISGLKGTYVELSTPAEESRRRAIYSAMIEREGMVWFFKMVGEADLVAGQQKAFRDFLESVRFK